jgi:hypothetical protein
MRGEHTASDVQALRGPVVAATDHPRFSTGILSAPIMLLLLVPAPVAAIIAAL